MNHVETLLNKLFLYPSELYTQPRYEKESMLKHLCENTNEFHGISSETLETILPMVFHDISIKGDNNLETFLNELDYFMEKYKYVKNEYEENEYDLVFDNMLWSVLDMIDEVLNRCELSI
jgi:endonuclease III-like uncharacterized protein